MLKLNTLKRGEGFTLIELMIVVAIIGILAAIAIPNFIRFQLRSKAGEGKLNLVAIRSAEGSYFGEYGTYIQLAIEPQTSGPAGAVPASSKRVWGPCPVPITMAAPGYCIIGYAPEGPTYYDYAVGAPFPSVGMGPATTNVDYFATAQSDIDGDLALNTWGLQVPQTNGAIAAAPVHAICAPGVLDEFGNVGLLGSIGPCTVGNGQTVF